MRNSNVKLQQALKKHQNKLAECIKLIKVASDKDLLLLSKEIQNRDRILQKHKMKEF